MKQNENREIALIVRPWNRSRAGTQVLQDSRGMRGRRIQRKKREHATHRRIEHELHRVADRREHSARVEVEALGAHGHTMHIGSDGGAGEQQRRCQGDDDVDDAEHAWHVRDGKQWLVR